ncbi:nek3 [Symbiodinium natans]|uniref:Nek3 protein n=1 Tax=Symbiodinium natans TaxID=878477 RepID=A0A812UNI7_9DINO|nr:nek3 [Symbiodinium natans]
MAVPSVSPSMAMRMPSAPGGTGLSGTVKSWNGAKGFGFIQSSALAADVMFSRMELPSDAQEVQGKFLTGRAVYFEAQEAPDGRFKATAVAIPYVEGSPVPGMIKSYSERHGWGFITSSSLTDDVRFDKNALAALDSLQPDVQLAGVKVVVEFVSRPDGKLNATRVLFQSGKIAERLGAKSPGFTAAPVKPSPMGPAGMVAAMPGIPGMVAAVQPPAQPAVATSTTLNSMIGVVKQYSDKNGYGFLNASGYPQDIKFGRNELNGMSHPGPGSIVSFTPVQARDGRLQALNVTPIASVDQQPTASLSARVQATQVRPKAAPPAAEMWPMAGNTHAGLGPPAAKRPRVAEMPTGQYAAGTIKTYNGLKGFGFITSAGVGEDIFFMRTWLPEECREMQGQELQGRNVLFELVNTVDGKLRAQSISMQ